MTEQPLSAEAMTLLSEILGSCGKAGLCRFPPCACTESIDALIAQRVSAETERCVQITLQYRAEVDAGEHAGLGHLGQCYAANLIGERIRAPAERPAPPIPELSVVRLTEDVEGIAAGTEGTVVHVYPGGRFAETGYAIEFSNPSRVETVARDQIEFVERPVPSALASTDPQPTTTPDPGYAVSPRSMELARYIREHLGSMPLRTDGDLAALLDAHMVPSALASTGAQPAPEGPNPFRASLLARMQEIQDKQPASAAAVVDYTERAREIAHWWFGPTPVEHDHPIIERITAALSAVASEATIAVVHRDWAKAVAAAKEEEHAAILARLQEPDVRETVAEATWDKKTSLPWGQASAVMRDRELVCADAAIARIAEMLK